MNTLLYKNKLLYLLFIIRLLFVSGGLLFSIVQLSYAGGGEDKTVYKKYDNLKDMSSHDKQSLSRIINNTEYRKMFLDHSCLGEEQLYLLSLYIKALPVQRLAVNAILATRIAAVDVKQTTVPPDKQVFNFEDGSIYQVSSAKARDILPHLSSGSIAGIIAALSHILFNNFPEGLVVDNPGTVCASGISEYCDSQLSSAFDKLNLTDLPEIFSESSQEELFRLLMNGTLNGGNGSQVNLAEVFAEGVSLLAPLHQFSIPTSETLAFAGLFVLAAYIQPVLLAVLHDPLVKVEGLVRKSVHTLGKRFPVLPGSEIALSLAIQRYIDDKEQVYRMIANINPTVLLQGIHQEDVLQFAELLKACAKSEGSDTTLIQVKELLETERFPKILEPRHHALCIVDVKNLACSAGGHSERVANIGGNILGMALTGALVYTLLHLTQLSLETNPSAVVTNVDFGEICGQLSQIQGDNCTLINGTIHQLDWPSQTQQALSDIVITLFITLAPNIRKLLRGGCHMAGSLVGTLFRIALFMQCCVRGESLESLDDEHKVPELITREIVGMNAGAEESDSAHINMDDKL